MHVDPRRQAGFDANIFGAPALPRLFLTLRGRRLKLAWRRSRFIVKKLVGFTSAAAKVGVSGFATVSDEDKLRRLAVCEGCDRAERANQRLVCRECGCVMDVKARFRATACPIGKW